MWRYIYPIISPKKFMAISSTMLPWLSITLIISISYGLIGALYLAPPDAIQSDAYRIIYVHVPCAFLSLLIYMIMTGAAISALVFRLTLAPLVIKHSASTGAIFTFLALVTGSIWGKPMWGTWWIWDARLTSELILLFLYLGILLFQSAIAGKQSGERAVAILILIGAIDIPIIHYSVNWWNTLHQGATLKVFSASAIDTSMIHPLLSMILAFTTYYGIVLFLRMNNELTAKQRHTRKIKC